MIIHERRFFPVHPPGSRPLLLKASECDAGQAFVAAMEVGAMFQLKGATFDPEKRVILFDWRPSSGGVEVLVSSKLCWCCRARLWCRSVVRRLLGRKEIIE